MIENSHKISSYIGSSRCIIKRTMQSDREIAIKENRDRRTQTSLI